MNLARRLLYFGGGFLIGLLLLMFFLGGKRTSCDYGPTARVLKNIRTKQLRLSDSADARLKALELDTSHINLVLRTGEVDFSRSETRLDSCRIYAIGGEVDAGELQFRVRNCTDTAMVMTVRFQPNQ
jgi:hypothetical protein